MNIKKEEKIKNKKSLKLIKNKNNLLKFIEYLIERIIDFIAGIIGIFILIPLTVIIFIANKLLHENGPIFYTQERIGKNGKTFKMLKYRTMVIGADEILENYLKENKAAREEYKKYKKLKNDPRITKLGKILRKTSLDEMPQLIHLISGKMSLVGPRPYLPREKEDMGECYNIIIQDKPGITGYWQTHGRSKTTFNERLKLDLEYNKQKSLGKYFEILYMTFVSLLKKDEAI